MKTCRKCGRSLPQEMFWARDRSPDGLQYCCKECMRPGYERREADRKRTAKALYAREWRERNTKRARAYRDENAATRAAQARASRYRRRVSDHLAETDTVAVLYASLNGATSGTTDARALVEHWSETGVANACVRCGRPWREIVHAVPLYDGGAHDITNLAPVCGRCG